jgi:hypothetical protein
LVPLRELLPWKQKKAKECERWTVSGKNRFLTESDKILLSLPCNFLLAKGPLPAIEAKYQIIVQNNRTK